MSPELLMRNADSLMIAMHAENVTTIYDTRHLRTPVEQNKVLCEFGQTSRCMSVALLAGTKARDAVQALNQKLSAYTRKALAAPTVSAANDNEAETPEEMEMDDDTGRTPERVEALYREIDRRLSALAAERESKARRGGPVHVANGGGEGGLAAGAGAAPDPSA
jgi:hypothetical protein